VSACASYGVTVGRGRLLAGGAGGSMSPESRVHHALLTVSTIRAMAGPGRGHHNSIPGSARVFVRTTVLRGTVQYGLYCMMAYPAGILRAGLAFRRKNLRPPQQPPGGFWPQSTNLCFGAPC
jgi:hypothetical protein